FPYTTLFRSVSNDAFKVIESDIVKEGTYGYNTVISSEIGAFSVSANKKNQTKGTMVVKFSPVLDMVAKVKRKLNITPDVDKNSMIVNFNMIDHLKGRAELLINSLIGLYNEESKEDGTKLSVATSDFINERLKLIEGDLKNVDKDLADYKTANKLNNTEMESGAFLQNALTVDQEVVELNAQLQVAEHLIKTLKQNTAVLLPSNVGIQDPALTSAINSYNQLVLEKQEYSKSMREDNPAMITLNQNIANVKEGIQGSLSLYRNNLQSSLKIVNTKKSTLNDKLSRLPAQELGFRNIARQQQIVESIYLFLLQKREEAEIKASATVDVLKVVDDAYGTNIPVTPKKN